MSITLRLEVKNAMQSSVGRRNGLSEAQLAGLQPRTKRIHESLKRRRQAGELAFYDLPYMRESIIEVMSFAGERIGRFENYVHVGMEGASLGSRALHQALNHSFHNYFTAKDRGGYPRLFFIDSVDPDRLAGLLAVIDPRQTLFNVISKSGGSPAAAAGFLYFLGALKKRLGEAWRRQVIFTTDPENGDLRALAKSERIKNFAIHPMVSERFFLLSPVGLLPAALSGIDVHGLLQGAIEMDGACRSGDVFKNPAYLFGAAHFLLETLKNKRRVAALPHAECLKEIAAWFQWLWEHDEKGERLRGDLAGAANVARDAQQRNFVEKLARQPNNKVITLVVVEKFRHVVALPAEFPQYASFRTAGNQTAQDFLQTQQRALSQSLVAARRPHLVVTFPAVRPEAVGEFIYMMQVAVTYLGELHKLRTLKIT